MDDVSSPFSGDHHASPPPPLAGAKRRRRRSKMIVSDDEDDDEREVGETVKPIGSVVRVSGVEVSRRYHFNGFEADGVSYVLEDTVLVIPDEHNMNRKPSIAIIKDISATEDGKITVTGQRFYRLEVAENINGEKWKSSESRELFYSFDKTEFLAESVMHKCCVHFIPPNKMIPRAKDHPGFIVRKVYDSKYKEITELVDTSYDDCKQHDINLLLEKTISKIPQLAVT